jgi:CelD/BcsL family acetyltransferase involved in cellulose biosynthesis
MLSLPANHWHDVEALVRRAPGVFAGPVRTRVVEPLALSAADLQCWDALAVAAESTNPFAQPWLQRLSLAHFDPGGKARLAVVEDRFGSWLGAMPLALERTGGVRTPMWSASGHANQFTGTPLVRADRAEAFWQEVLGWLDTAPGGALALELHNLALDDQVNRALFELCQRQGRRVAFDRRWQRAMLSPGSAPCEPGGKLRRRIEGLERKLEREHGPPSLELARSPARIAALIEAFVALEGAGWKGQQGSALASHQATRSYFAEVARTGAAHGVFEIGVLRSRTRIVAMSTQLLASATVHGFKAAYDEAFAAHAPGLLLLCRLTRHWQAQGTLLVDSCTRPGQEPISKLWPGRRDLADCRIALGGSRRRTGFAALLAAEKAWHKAKRLVGNAGKA